MISTLDRLTTGFLVPARGLNIIMTHSRVRRLAVLPFFLTVVIFVVGVTWSFPVLTELVSSFTTKVIAIIGVAKTSSFASALSWIIPIMTWPVVIFAALYMIFILTRIAVAPLYALLAERVLIEKGALPESPFRFGVWLATSVRMFGVSVLRGFLFGLLGAVLFVFSFVPGLGLLTGFCFLVLVAFDICDYALEALQMNLSERIYFFRRHIAVMVGLGAIMGLVFLVPGLNFFLFPAAVAGAADVVRRFAAVEFASR
jgi:uncharacterized protein involved in cysteine biosynthesis